MHPQQASIRAQQARASCTAPGVALPPPSPENDLRIVKASQNLAVFNRLKDLTKEEAKQLAAAVSGESAEH